MTPTERTAHFFGAIQCAPVLAGIKSSNLLQVDRRVGPQTVQSFLKGTGLHCSYLYRSGQKDVWLVFRAEEMRALLADPAKRDFLASFGYADFSIGAVTERLRQNLAEYLAGGDYPHEVGILLGYPLEDVRGFIEQHGKNYLHSGFWKVYGNVVEAKRLFASIRRARARAALGAEKGMSYRELAESFRNLRAAEAV